MAKILLGDPASMLTLPAECPTHCSSFWTLPENMTVKRFSQLVEQSSEHSSLHLLIMFLQKVLLLLLYPVCALVAVCNIDQYLLPLQMALYHTDEPILRKIMFNLSSPNRLIIIACFSLNCQIHCVKQLHHLPELAALQSDLLRIGPLTSDCRSQSIAQVLENMPAGGPTFLYKTLVKTNICSNLNFPSSPSGCQKKMLVGRVERFITVWNSLRADVANNGKAQKTSRVSRCFSSKCKCVCACV